MSAKRFTRYSTLAASFLTVSLSAASVSATDWYWVNDFGGTWDEEIGGVAGWRAPDDSSGIPAAGDDALLVLPYSFSFCNPDGSCFTQPVLVLYRSDTDLILDELIIESENMLLQQEGTGATVAQLNLTSNMEIVGGSGRAFSPPASFFLPDPPGIFPQGEHIQRAGTNTVNLQLIIADASGSSGQYELADTGVLSVGSLEIVGDGGEGYFFQTGGDHTTDILILGREAGGSGRFEISGGSLEANTIIVSRHGYGSFEQHFGFVFTDTISIGQEVGTGTELPNYVIDGGTLRIYNELTVGVQDPGRFDQMDGLVRICPQDGPIPAQVTIGDHATGFVNLSGGLFHVEGFETIGNNALGLFAQTGGRHLVTRWGGVGGTLTVGFVENADYNLSGGELEADGLALATAGGYGYFWHDGPGSHVTVESMVLANAPATHGISSYDAEYILNHGNLSATYLTIGAGFVGPGARGLLEQRSADTVVTVGAEEVIGAEGDGRYVQFAGLHNVLGSLKLGSTSSGSGTYSLIDGSLNVNGLELIGFSGEGVLNQSGGTHTITGNLVLGFYGSSHGRYELAGASSQLEVAGYVRIGMGGEGLFDHLSGTHTLDGDMTLGTDVGSVGTYTLHTGHLEVSGVESIGFHGTGLFEQFGGRHTVAGRLEVGTAAPRAIYRLNDGHLEVGDEVIGAGFKPIGGEGDRFEHISGTHEAETLTLHGRGDATAEYEFSDGRLEVGHYMIVGDEHGTARFNQTGDFSHASIEELYVGHSQHSSGRYSLTGGSLQVFRSLHIGQWSSSGSLSDWSTGRFVQNGIWTDHLVHGTLEVGPEGRYDLHHGLLRTGAVHIAGGELGDQKGEFAQWGGTHQIAGTLRLQASRYVHPSGDTSLSGWGGTYYLHGGGLYVDRDLIIEEVADPAFTHAYGFFDGRLNTYGTSIIDVGSDSLHNHGVVTMTGPGVTTIQGTVKNHGLFEVTDTMADFYGAFLHDGEYRSTAAESHFEDLTVGTEGYIIASEGDTFYVGGDFLNGSHEAELWDTNDATLSLGGRGRKTVALPGENRGDSPASRIDNFAWGVLEVLNGVEVGFTDGNTDNDGMALYVGVLDIKDRTQIDADNLQVLPFFGDAVIYYDPSLLENEYLGGQTYIFAEGGGTLSAQIPEPATIWLIISELSLIWLAVQRHPFKPIVF